jgi:hypothetical protein
MKGLGRPGDVFNDFQGTKEKKRKENSRPFFLIRSRFIVMLLAGASILGALTLPKQWSL